MGRVVKILGLFLIYYIVFENLVLVSLLEYVGGVFCCG